VLAPLLASAIAPHSPEVVGAVRVLHVQRIDEAAMQSRISGHTMCETCPPLQGEHGFRHRKGRNRDSLDEREEGRNSVEEVAVQDLSLRGLHKTWLKDTGLSFF
jgi:hypothetical protein